MTVAPTTYTQAEAGLDAVTEEVAGIIESVRTAIARIDAALVKVGQLDEPAPTGYLDLLTYLNQQMTANPGDAEWAALSGRAGKIGGDFTGLQTYLNELTAAIKAV